MVPQIMKVSYKTMTPDKLIAYQLQTAEMQKSKIIPETVISLTQHLNNILTGTEALIPS